MKSKPTSRFVLVLLCLLAVCGPVPAEAGRPKQTQTEATFLNWDAEAQTSLAIDYLRRHDRARPFCLFLSWGPPHHPYRLAPQSYLDLYDPAAIPGRPNCREVPRDDLWGYYAQTTFLDDQLQ